MMVFTVWDICQDHNDPADWYVFKLGLWLDQADNTPASPAAAARTSRIRGRTLRTLPGNSVERNTSKCKSCILYDDVAIQSLFPLHCWSLQMMNNNNSRPRVWQQLPVQCLESVVTSVMVCQYCQFKYLLSQQTWLGPGPQPSAFTTL